MIEYGLIGWEKAMTIIGCALGLAGLAVLAYEVWDAWQEEREMNEKGL